MSSASSLQEVYARFASFGKSQQDASGAAMDGKAFAKLCKDCKLLDPKFTSTDVDLIFANNKVKNKAERKITFLQFTVALDLVAERKGVPIADIHQKLLQQGGPATNNTQKAETSEIGRAHV